MFIHMNKTYYNIKEFDIHIAYLRYSKLKYDITHTVKINNFNKKKQGE